LIDGNVFQTATNKIQIVYMQTKQVTAAKQSQKYAKYYMCDFTAGARHLLCIVIIINVTE